MVPRWVLGWGYVFLPDAYPEPELELEPDLLPNPWVFKTNSTVPSTTPGRRFFRVVLSMEGYFRLMRMLISTSDL